MWTKTIRNKQKTVGFVYPPKPAEPPKNLAQQSKEIARARYQKFLDKKNEAEKLKHGEVHPQGRNLTCP